MDIVRKWRTEAKAWLRENLLAVQTAPTQRERRRLLRARARFKAVTFFVRYSKNLRFRGL